MRAGEAEFGIPAARPGENVRGGLVNGLRYVHKAGVDFYLKDTTDEISLSL